MQQGNSSDRTIQDWLTTVGISLLCEWDAVVFLYRHGTTLSSAEHIASLLGYPKAETDAALEKLASIQLVRWSRNSRGVCSYQFVTPADPTVHQCFQELINFAETRSGRLLLVQQIALIERSRRREGLHLT